MIDPDKHHLNLQKMSKNSDTVPAIWIVIIIVGGIFLFLFKELTERPTEISPFKMPNLFNEKSYITDSDIKNNGPAIVNFWTSWCGACRFEHSFLKKLSKEHHVKIFGVNCDNDKQTAREFLATHGNPYLKVGTDEVRSLRNSFYVTGFPTNFIINKDGKITRSFGVIDESNIKEILHEFRPFKHQMRHGGLKKVR